ncbi:MAG: hypothetical protein A3F11_08760 [Gammaproteobacteria bacterium RIFCSPHIGHO2_12_FULL_37_14]|nr:MAG: hypothetical protein A3F11_08760 [Gammaproteobacteria bacterium RIFCSPHIGHO2_12_FULL_37_14]
MHYDLIIVGGGLVGSSLALALRESELKIALIEASLPQADNPRLFGLTESSCQSLKNLGLWQQLKEHATPIHQVHVSYQGYFGAVRLNHADVGLSQLGYVIPARYLEKILHAEIIQQANITYYCPATLKNLQQTHVATLNIVTGEGEKNLLSPIVIAADGAASTVRSLLNIETEIVDYQQGAIVTETMLQRSHQHIAYERFNASGAIAMLPLVGDRCATIWTADQMTIDQLMALSDECFVTALQKEFGYRLGRLLGIAKRHAFPLKMIQAKETHKQCVLLLGNAAHALHPIAAQGFNLALYEVSALSAAMLDKNNKYESFTSNDLQKIIQCTQKQRFFSMQASHQLARLPNYHSLVLNMFLSLGMVGLDITKPLKSNLIKRISGLLH